MILDQNVKFLVELCMIKMDLEMKFGDVLQLLLGFSQIFFTWFPSPPLFPLVVCFLIFFTTCPIINLTVLTNTSNSTFFFIITQLIRGDLISCCGS